MSPELPQPHSALRDSATAGAFGMVMGAVIAVGGMIWTGSGRGFPEGTSFLEALLIFVTCLGVAGVIGGLLRPMLSTLRAQILLTFSALLSFLAGLAMLSSAPAESLRTAILYAALAAPVGVWIGRGLGLFDELSAKSEVTDGSTSSDAALPTKEG